MTRQPHILIIGAGLIGLANARAFIDRGANVTLIERKAAIGHGAGFANSGMIHPSQAWPWIDSGLDKAAQLKAAHAVAKLARAAPKQLRQRMEALSLPDIKRGQGCYQIFDTPLKRDLSKTRYQQINITADTTNQLSYPALYFPDDASGNAYEWSRAEAAALINEGVKLHTQVNIKLTASSQGIKAVLNGENVSPDHIILCAGHHTNTALKPLGLHLPIRSIRGFALDFDSAAIDVSGLPDVPVMDAASRTALTRFDNVIRLSGTLGDISARPLWERWCRIMPDVMRGLPRPHHVWSGERPVSLLGRPIISPTPIKGLWVNTGHGHMGWTLSKVSGGLMAQMILDGQMAPSFAWPDSTDYFP